VSVPAGDLVVAFGKVLISAWVLYGIVRYGRTLEPIVRRVRWAIVLTGFLAVCIMFKFFSHVSEFVFICILIPTALFFILPDLSVQLVRTVRAITRHAAQN
jgi:hypothetical protein